MKKKDNQKFVRLQLAQVNVDPAQYKPYSHTLTAENIFVDIPVDEDEVLETGKTIILTVDGLTSVLRNLADSLQEMDGLRRKSNLGH